MGREGKLIVDYDTCKRPATRYHFDLLGRPDYTELPNGVVEDYVFDNMDRLDLMQHFQSDSNNADLTDNALKNMFDYSYRADGKRVGLVERFDTSGSGIRPGSSTLTNSYTWTYDNASRLVSEVLDSSDNTLDQTESFLMDLVGNRMRRTLDKPGTANDTTDIYTYDASDRILNELRYFGLFATGNPTGSPTQTTSYTWNATQQSSKTVSVPSVSSMVQFMSYGLGGQLERVTTTQDGNGQTTDRKQVEYRYDPQGIRFIASDYAYNNQTSNFTLQTSTEYLIDHANFTGYQQTIIETTKNATGQTTKRISYTYGLDEITQTTTEIDPVSQLATRSSQLTFAHDGHGSTRVLFEAAAVIAQIYTYSAYGELIALHNSLGSNLTSQASPLTSVLYNGESLDPTTGLYNFRARWYAAGNGRFERLDPFAGNPNDPFSFNKYGFTHGDPVMGIDPSGEFLIGLVGAIFSIGTVRSQEKVKVHIGKEVGMGLGIAVASSVFFGGVFRQIGLDTAKGGIYGFQLGLGLYFAYRTKRWEKALAEGLADGLGRVPRPAMEAVFDGLAKGKFPANGAGKVFEDFFAGFSQGFFSGSTEVSPKADAFLDSLDGGITQLFSDYFSGKVNSISDAGISMFMGTIKTGISKLAKALNDSANPGGNEYTEAYIAATLRFIFTSFAKMIDNNAQF